MAESIDTHLGVIHRVVDSLREEGVTEQNKREVAEAIYAIALSLGALQGRIAALDQGPGWSCAGHGEIRVIRPRFSNGTCYSEHLRVQGAGNWEVEFATSKQRLS